MTNGQRTPLPSAGDGLLVIGYGLSENAVDAAGAHAHGAATSVAVRSGMRMGCGAPATGPVIGLVASHGGEGTAAPVLRAPNARLLE